MKKLGWFLTGAYTMNFWIGLIFIYLDMFRGQGILIVIFCILGIILNILFLQEKWGDY